MVSAGLVNYLFHRGRIRKKQISSAACRPVSPLLPVVLLPRPLYLRKDGETVRSERSAPGVTDPHAMGFLEDFQASVEALPAMLNKNYSLMRELDKSLQGVQLENEQRCQQEIEDIKHGLESGSITFDPAKLKFSDEAIEEQRHCIRIADEKVALATQTYDLVDAHIQQLDQFMRKLEELRQEKEAPTVVAATATATVTATANANANAGVSSADATPKGGRSGERGRGGRKKAKVQPVLPAPAVALELPVDPNEPTYCLCNQVSFGEMVACDNPDCKIEWFHFECVGVKEQPKGKWYCPNCIGFQKKRKGK